MNPLQHRVYTESVSEKSGSENIFSSDLLNPKTNFKWRIKFITVIIVDCHLILCVLYYQICSVCRYNLVADNTEKLFSPVLSQTLKCWLLSSLNKIVIIFG